MREIDAGRDRGVRRGAQKQQLGDAEPQDVVDRPPRAAPAACSGNRRSAHRSGRAGAARWRPAAGRRPGRGPTARPLPCGPRSRRRAAACGAGRRRSDRGRLVGRSVRPRCQVRSRFYRKVLLMPWSGLWSGARLPAQTSLRKHRSGKFRMACRPSRRVEPEPGGRILPAWQPSRTSPPKPHRSSRQTEAGGRRRRARKRSAARKGPNPPATATGNTTAAAPISERAIRVICA